MKTTGLKPTWKHMLHMMTFTDRRGGRVGGNIITLMQSTDMLGLWWEVKMQYGPKGVTSGIILKCEDDPISRFTIGMTIFELAARCAPVGLLREEEPA